MTNSHTARRFRLRPMSESALLSNALRVSAASAVWTIIASTAAVAIGLIDDSLALVAFGAVGLFDCASSCVLVAHFHAIRIGGTAEHMEGIVLRVVAAGLIAIGLVVGVISVVHLIDHVAASSSPAGIILAGMSLVVLAALAVGKRHIAVRLPSRALRADGHLTAVGAVLAAVTLAGSAVSERVGWWWADPAAALIIALGAIGLSLVVAKDISG